MTLMELPMYGLLVLGFLFVCALIGAIVDAHQAEKKDKQIQNTIDDIKNKLNILGVLFDHSLKLTNTKTGNITYFRLYNIYYDYVKNQYLAKGYICDKDNQIGKWTDDVKYLYTIPVNCTIEDCGEWNPNNF